MRDSQRHPQAGPGRFVPAILLFAFAIVTASARGQVMDPAHPAETMRPSHVDSALACADCHRCERPTAQAPCLGPCPRHRGHFVGSHAADEGPEVVVIGQLAELYEPVVFSHRLHAQMSAMSGGCQLCHHYSEPSGTVPPCGECHDATPTAMNLRQPSLKGAYHRQCINCHLDWSHENACGFCHAESGKSGSGAKVDKTDLLAVRHPLIAAKPFHTYETAYEKGPLVTFHHADHVDQFGLKCVDCHRGESCSQCHDTLKSRTATTGHHKVERLTTCGACHAERDCAFCHSKEVRPAFDHTTSTDFPLTRFHAEVACATCHGQPKSFRTPSPRCASCHIHWVEGSFDHAVVGLALDEIHREAACADCHRDLDFVAGPSCGECHEEPMYPQRLPGKRVG